MGLCEPPRAIAATPRGLVVLAARGGGDRRVGGGSSGSGARAVPPERLLSPAAQDPQRRDTVYTLRLSTGLQRGAALTDPTAGVLVRCGAVGGTCAAAPQGTLLESDCLLHACQNRNTF